MIATTRLRMTDLSQQRRVETDLDDELTPRHSVGQAIDYFLDHARVPDNGLSWLAFSRGVRLDRKQLLADVALEDEAWTVMPEVSAGGLEG